MRVVSKWDGGPVFLFFTTGPSLSVMESVSLLVSEQWVVSKWDGSLGFISSSAKGSLGVGLRPWIYWFLSKRSSLSGMKALGLLAHHSSRVSSQSGMEAVSLLASHQRVVSKWDGGLRVIGFSVVSEWKRGHGFMGSSTEGRLEVGLRP